MKKTILAAIAAFGIGYGARAGGDVFSITPCDETGVNLTSAYTSPESPVGAGKELYFKVVLATHRANGEYWRLSYTGIGSEQWDETFNPLQMGIYVSGRLQYASLVSFRKHSTNPQQSEMIFKYVTKAGDFALPILLASVDADGKTVPVRGDLSSGYSYYFNPLTSGDWKVQFNDTDTPSSSTNLIDCTWQVGVASSFLPPPGAKPAMHSDSLEDAGFYVKTVGFSDDAESGDFWRTVHENSTITGGGTVPKLTMDAAAEVETTVYVWSDDESAVKIRGGTAKAIRFNGSGTDVRNIQVGTITFKGGQTEQDFLIEGAAGGEDRTANLILSAYDDFNYSSSTGARITDYLTAKVKCIEPLPPSIVIDCDRSTAYASGNYTTYAAVLQVYLSQACTNPVEVTISPSFTDGSSADFSKYLRFSTVDTIDEPSLDGSDYKTPTVTIPANYTGKQTIYLFCLRSDSHTIGNAKLKLSSATTSEEIKAENCGSKSINVAAELTEITTPAEGSKIATTCNDEYPFTIAVDDTFADTHDTETGYKIYVKYRASDTFKQLDGVYYVGDGNALYRLDMKDPEHPIKTQDLPILKYTASGEGLESQVYVVAPVNPNTANAKKSAVRTFIADVKEARTVKIVSYDEDFTEEKRSFDEGSDVGFRITLSEKNETGSPIYAYIKPSANATAEMFSCQTYNCIVGMSAPAGLPINNSLDSNDAIVTLLDGYAKPGLKITFEVMLSSDPNWDGVDETKRLTGYDSNYLTITAYNIEPTIKRIEMNGNKSLNDGYTFSNKLPMGQTQRFQVYVNEPGKYDLTGEENPFAVRWTASLDGQTYDDPLILYGNPSTNLFKYAFPAAGTWKVTAEVKDKDMDDWAELDYSVYATVLEQPALEGPTDETTIPETDLRSWKYHIGVSYYDPKYTGTLKVIVSVGQYSEGKANPGRFKLDPNYLMSAEAAKAAIDAAAIEGFAYNANCDYYLVELTKSKLRQDLAVEELDGTDNSSIYGFVVSGHVINGDVLPTSGKPAKEYYLESNTTRVLVNNMTPTFGTITVENTNAWKVAGTTATSYPIRWQVKNDVSADWESGITVEFLGCANAADGKKVLYSPTAGTFTPNFGSAQGEQTVTMTIYDKDGGSQTWTYLYFVEPRKNLVVRPYGPASTTESYYDAALGLGRGRVYADGTLESVQSFVQTWSYGVSAAQAQMYATGYAAKTDAAGDPVAYNDDGTLGDGSPKRDVALSASGQKYAGGAYYSYDGKYDNFFYRWMYLVTDDAGGASEKSYSAVKIQTRSGEEAVAPKFALDTYEENKESYLAREAEAIFSRELKVEDNLGDINADGIPDLYMRWYKFDAFDDEGELSGSDLGDHFVDWDDGDYLPTAESIAARTSVGTTNTWATKSENFGPVQEIRGYNDETTGEASHFNDAYQILAAGVGTGKAVALLAGVTADMRFTDPDTDERSTLSRAEWVAYRNYCAAKGWDSSDASHWGLKDGGYDNSWSPERPTNPNDDDTDGDGLTDGLEYYLWYQAHVGSLDADGNQVRLAGRRYNVLRPLDPDVISSDSIEALFDPLVKGKLEDRDTDNDALTDLEEFILGTSPVDFDSDNDGLPDGYEVVRSATDPTRYSSDGSKSDGELNPDGDSMAVIGEIAEVRTWLDDGGATNYFVCAEGFELDEAGVILSASGTVYRAWRYSGVDRFCRGVELTDDTEYVGKTIVGEPLEVTLLDLHFQVYQKAGFDPRTGWNIPPYYAGHLVNSTPYTHLDECLSISFYLNAGGIAPATASLADNYLVTLWTDGSTDPLSADTDADGMPDGWELYVQAGMSADAAARSPDWYYSPLQDFAKIAGTSAADPDGDNLDFQHEYSGVESVALYSETCSTITLLDPAWQNKIWPTDPWAEDTDGDGLKDGEEFGYFVFGSEVQGTGYGSVVNGGGLNPLSWDTDRDGLPDPWEAGFAGTATVDASTTSTVVSEDATTTNTVTTAGAATWNNDGMNGTVADFMLDYDHDGLLNWQEYMVGAMRCWRYDDTFSTWQNQTVEGMGEFTDDDWYDTLVNADSGRFNPGLWDSHFNPGNYFEPCTNAFDLGACGYFYMFADGVGHKRAAAWSAKAGLLIRPPAAVDYATCDPRVADTDGDGMDDYWELFHGLNPLLGMVSTEYGVGNTYPCYSWAYARDVVAECWARNNSFTYYFDATSNYWTSDEDHRPRTDVPLRIKSSSSWYDFFQYPWLAGLATADPDGDNIRNQQEAIFPNVQASSTYQHTDPSALWMTDSSYPDSLTYRYYQMFNPHYARSGTITVDKDSFEHEGVVYKFTDFPWLSVATLGGKFLVSSKFELFNNRTAPIYWKNADTMFSFEENEGYDSDHDFLGDFEESQGKTKTSSDPQDHDDPLRRQAMWFGGEANPGFLETPLADDEQPACKPASAESRQNFLYYTVECWAKADPSTYDTDGLQTLVERAIGTGVSGPADETYLRKNFLIGLKGGRWYTKFDSTGTDAKQAVEITDGPDVTTNWTHVAATYDGESLKLYVNGALTRTKPTAIQPEHGLSAITLSENGEQGDYTYRWGISPDNRRYPLAAILVGASAMDTGAIVFDQAWKRRGMWRATEDNPLGVNQLYAARIGDYGRFFKGYIDEVRIWDGARTTTEIQNDYMNRTRYTTALAAANRQAVYEVWEENGGGTRAKVQGKTELPAQLMYHWAFDHVAGAVKAEDVIKEPAGFATEASVVDSKAIWTRPANWINNWYASIDSSIRSKVYTDLASVPWINNTVAHLPRFDTTTVDSFYWSEDFAGATPAGDYGYTGFAFARNNELPSRWTQQIYNGDSVVYSADTRWNMLNAGTNVDAKALSAYRFARRDQLTVGGDLITFGGAFPKRISSAEGGMWDDQGASDAWAETGADSDNDGLPDWWAEFAENEYCPQATPIDWNTTVSYYGHEMTAMEAYKRDLAKGMLPDTEYYKEYADTRDSDNDGIPDWWEDLYGVDTGSYADATADSDNDGLSNFVEYMLSEVFDLKDSKGNPLYFNPNNPFSVNASVSDYFYQIGSLYAGEIFTDHDRMSDVWEHQYLDDVSPYLYDAGRDPDGDGWSNYAEFQAGTDPTLLGDIGVDMVQMDEYPVPVIEITLNYEGNQAVSGKPLVVKAWSDPNLESIPDAVWSIGTVAESSENTEGETNVVSGVKYFGMNPRKELSFHLSPGSIVKNSVYFEFKDPAWYLLDTDTGATYMYDASSAVWAQSLIDKENPEENGQGWIYDKYNQTNVGTIDYNTGAVVLDLTKVASYLAIDGNIAGDLTDGNFVSVYNLDQSYIRAKWASKPIIGGKKFTYYLADAEEPSESNNSLGHVKEGENTFIAFYDLDGDGNYTAGEPYGFANGVNVGWNYAKVVIELTDTSAVSARFNAQDGTNDRATLYGSWSGNLEESRIGDGTVSGGVYERVRVVRTLVDDYDVTELGVPARVVLDKMIHVGGEQLYVTEADFLKDGNFDIDWEYLAADLAAGQTERLTVSNVSYRIVLGSGSVKNSETNNLLKLVFNRQFDYKDVYTDASQKPVIVDSGIVNSASPTFSWYVPNGLNSYTAFEINVYQGKTRIWNSGFQFLPARIRDERYGWRYDWTAPIYAGDRLLNGTVFANNANYTWEVRVTNARFRNIANWSLPGEFRMNVLTNSADYGTINVAVRHYGPAEIRQSGTIRVQAFATPDFSGTPVGQGYVASTAAVASKGEITVGNASIIGVKAGNYYLRAFVDSNNDGVCQDWETWGFHCSRDYDTGTIYTPRSVQVGPAIGINTVVPVYLDDSDTDTDNLPDAWEYLMASDAQREDGTFLDNLGVTSLDETLANGIAVKQSLAGKITASGSIRGGLSVLTLQSLSNPYMAALACGVPVTSGETAEEVSAALQATADELSAEDSAVEITGIGLDYAKHAVVVDVAGSLANVGSSAMSLYSFEGTAGKTYEFRLMRKDTLMDREWTEVATVSFTLGLSEKSVEIPVDADVDFNSGFFMIQPAED